MPRLRHSGGLGSRVALRTFILFCLCSVAPVLLFAVLGYRFVLVEIEQQATARLNDASKRYGVIVYERLREASARLREIARTPGRASQAGTLDDTDSEVLRVVSVTQPVDKASPQHTLEVVPVGGGRTVRIHERLIVDGTPREIVGELRPEDLWNSDVVSLPGASLCVYLQTGDPLHCASSDWPAARADTELTGEWSLFLRAEYGVNDWVIRVTELRSTALSSARAFQYTLLMSAALAVLIALLLSAVQIRRSHRPLALLTSATKRMSQGHFDTRVRIAGDDEYAGLGRAFNRMGANLRRQFRLLSAFARIDRMILAQPAVEPIVQSLLPHVLTLLRCDSAAILLRATDGGQDSLYVASASASDVVQKHRVQLRAETLRMLGGSSRRWLTPGELDESALPMLIGAGSTLWHTAPITVGAQTRGTLILSFSSARVKRASTTRHAARLAQRLAVALGNEDREQALLRQAYYDGLTQLPNRQLFKDRLTQDLARARCAGQPVALLFIDLDRFKNVNDSLGHSAGDFLLQQTAARLRSVMRETDTLARLGGDEFTVITPGATMASASACAARLLAALRPPLDINGVQCVVQASIGIALFPQDGDDAETLLRNADTALYRAKARGRGVAVFFEETMNAQALRRLHIEQRLRAALEAGELQQHYQLKVSAQDGHIAGCEALARWTDSQFGAVSPVEFVAVAEETGLIRKLDEWSIRTACRTARRWAQAKAPGAPHIAVNVSLRHVRDHSFVRFVEKCLREFDLPASALELEITESTLADRPDEVSRVLAAVRALGVRIAIDDFGTGYSSMSMLQKLPIDILKIDRSFVTHCTEDANAATLLRALVNVARGLGKEIVVEGVETPEQAAFLRALGCEYLQGFLFARPMPAAALEQQTDVLPVWRRA